MMRRLAVVVWLLASSAFAQTTVAINGHNYTVSAHPRGYFDGPSGTITTRIKDPDGAGALKAPRAVDGDAAYEGLKLAVRTCAAANPPTCGYAYTLLPLLALDWYMDNNQTNSLNAAIYYLNNFERFFATPGGDPEFGCDYNVLYCGIQDYSHYSSYPIETANIAYTLVQSEMSAAERTAFLQKVLNDVTVSNDDGTCDNQFQDTGATINYTPGATTITGSGLAGVTVGAVVLAKPNLLTRGGFATVASVDGDGQITLSAPVKEYSGPNFASAISGGLLWELQAITSTTCSATWKALQHTSNYRDTFGERYETRTTSTITPATTSFNVLDASGFPATPFPVKLRGADWMLVTNVTSNTLTVTRGHFGTTPGTRAPDQIWYEKYAPNGANSPEASSNRVMLKSVSTLLAALNGLEQFPTQAQKWIEEAANHWEDARGYIIPQWTGYSAGGSYYHYAINQQYAVALAHAVSQLTPEAGSPALGSSSDLWPERAVYQLLYNGLPGAVTTPFSWGQIIGLAPTNSYHIVPWFSVLNHDSTADRYAQYWLRTLSSEYVSSTLGSQAGSTAILWKLLTFTEASQTQTDYRSVLPKHRVFNVVDAPAGKPWSVLLSRTGFSSSSDTVFYADAAYIPPLGSWDHRGAGAPGSYRIYKIGYLLTEPSNTNVNDRNNSNMMLFGGAHNLKAISGETPTVEQVVWLDKTANESDWVYARVNSLNAYTTAAAASRALRHFIHFKNGTKDYVVVYDDAASSSGKTKSFNLFYDEAATTFAVSLPDITSRFSNRSLLTKVVYPSGTGVAVTTSAQTYGKVATLCASADGSSCDATNTAADFLLVHQPSATAADTLSTTTGLGTISSNFRGVQIADAGQPSVAVFPKVGGQYTSSSFTTTHSGTGQYVVTGLAAGAYDVVRDGSVTVLDDQVVDENGVISFESTSGAFTVNEGTAPPPSITILTTSLPNGQEDVAYSQTLTYTGGTPPVTWSVSAGALCTGLSLNGSTGEISGTVADPGSCSFTVLVTDDASQTDTQDLSIEFTAAPAAVTITTTSLPNGVRNAAYSQALQYTGGTAPVTWSIDSGALCTGLSLNASSGAITGTPTLAETCSFTAKITDDAAQSDTQVLSIQIDNAQSPTLTILTQGLPNAVKNLPYSQALQYTGGTPPVTWDVSAGALCSSFTMSSTGVISTAAATTEETCTFTARITDDVAATDIQELSITVVLPGPTMQVSVTPGSTGAVIQFSTRFLPREQDCTATVTSLAVNESTGEIVGVVGSATTAEGFSSRVVSVGGLEPETDHQVEVTCGSVASGSATFTTKPALSGSIDWKFTHTPSALLAAQGAAKVSYYATRLDAAGDVESLHNACSPGPCTVTLSLASGGRYSVIYAWEDSGNTEITRSSRPQLIVVP